MAYIRVSRRFKSSKKNCLDKQVRTSQSKRTASFSNGPIAKPPSRALLASDSSAALARVLPGRGYFFPRVCSAPPPRPQSPTGSPPSVFQKFASGLRVPRSLTLPWPHASSARLSACGATRARCACPRLRGEYPPAPVVPATRLQGLRGDTFPERLELGRARTEECQSGRRPELGRGSEKGWQKGLEPGGSHWQSRKEWSRQTLTLQLSSSPLGSAVRAGNQHFA